MGRMPTLDVSGPLEVPRCSTLRWILVLWFLWSSILPAFAETVLLSGATVHTVAGTTFAPGQVLIRDSKIEAVDKVVKAQADKVVNLAGLHLYPGLIAASTSLGLIEINAIRATRDASEVGDYTPDVESWVAVNPDSELIPVARANGITHFLPVPGGGIVAGQSGLMVADGWTSVRGLETIQARHSLLMDNLMDLSHETYLHGGYIGTPEVAETPITAEVDADAGVVRVSRHMDDAECPPFYANSTGISGRITRWQDIEFAPPCLYRLHSRVAPQGHYPPEGYVPGRDAAGDPGAYHTEIVYALTPETAHSVHDFWMVARDFAFEDAAVTDYLYENNHTVVMQDVHALNLIEEVIAQEERVSGTVPELSIAIDTGALAARRLMKKLIGPAAEPVVP